MAVQKLYVTRIPAMSICFASTMYQALLRTLYVYNSFNPYSNPVSMHCYLHFADEETEAFRVICPRPPGNKR